MCAMAILTFIWYIVSSAGFMDCVSNIKVTNFAAVAITARIVGILQFLLSDGILVRHSVVTSSYC
jgi:hypothetical protein